MITSIDELQMSDKRVLFLLYEERWKRNSRLACHGCGDQEDYKSTIRKVFASDNLFLEGAARTLVSERLCEGYSPSQPNPSQYLEKDEGKDITSVIRISSQKVDVEPKEITSVGTRLFYKGLPIEN